MGHWSDTFYGHSNFPLLTYTVSNTENQDHGIEDTVPYHSNIVVINCLNFEEFEDSLRKTAESPYWHPLGNVILQFRTIQNDITVAKIFFALWYFKCPNAAIIQYDDDNEVLYLSSFEPYLYENYTLPLVFGCRTTRKIGIPIDGFQNGLTCEEGCYNVSSQSTFRANNLGTCIGFHSQSIPYSELKIVKTPDLFKPKGKDLHGFPLRAFTTEIKPFLTIEEEANNTYTIGARDGELWKAMAKYMNFTIDLSPSVGVMKLPFNFELNIQHIFSFGHRKADLFLIPIYQMDLIIVELDQTFIIADSGVCLAAPRAEFETILFDFKLLQNNYIMIIKFIFSFVGSWIVFSFFNFAEKSDISLDQIGKDFLNSVRNTLIISLLNPPKKGSFKIFLGFSLWSYFVLNFASQAAITSFFTAMKKGKEVETFEDVIERGYIIEGMASPDVVLPDTEEKFRKINSKLVPINNLFTCIERMKNDTRRFCLIDCEVGRYLEQNELNYKGQQYLHIIKDKVHNHYLNMIFSKHSALTEQFNKHMMAIFEGGLVRKWEQYRFSELKQEIPVKPLGMEELSSIFKCYFLFLGFTFILFILEITLGSLNRIVKNKSTGN
ncbi:uncharacterized protein LOC125230349 [Leguminivora glycinivorella]|uniref:uncharacterized protein LOC125230349 n=1 Tax=Leguminivora glycinivorella TaxID=1035111 RepID=UPI00200CE0FE|nr:uncharacterized protein LOC125230349 [Leguminivora glycinivorella]